MPVGDIKAAAKRKAKEKVVKTAKRKITRASGNNSGGGGRSRKKGSKLPIILLIILVIVGIGVAWHFGFLDGFFESGGEAQPPAVVAVDGQLEMHFIDVGQADGVLIITDGGTMLIDAGDHRGSGQRLVNYIQDLGITELTYVIGTHPHADHIGGMHIVLDTFDIGTLLLPPVSHTTQVYERMITAIENNNVNTRVAMVGDVIHIGDAVFTILHPNDEDHWGLNCWSVSVRMAFGETSLVVTGDAERPAEMAMLESGQYLSADILRVGHHGSRTSTSQEFFDAVSPSIAVIQVGEGNRYNHPHDCVMERLSDAGVRIYRNDHHGDIIITSDGRNLDVRTAR
ncbi:MAG: MBL fold metallo-hydrolase [Defluviitaleaceae bacterium]|nr:MBL fold metallo-hydrolase [Defluviitaleaceae bacterium]